MTVTEVIAAAKEKGIELSQADAERYAAALTEWARPWDEPVDLGVSNDVIDFKKLLGIFEWKDFMRPTL